MDETAAGPAPPTDYFDAVMEIEDGSIHRPFVVTEPTGHRIKFFDSHVSEFVV